jgi:uncharacterized membrane protein YfcA
MPCGFFFFGGPAHVRRLRRSYDDLYQAAPAKLVFGRGVGVGYVSGGFGTTGAAIGVPILGLLRLGRERRKGSHSFTIEAM